MRGKGVARTVYNGKGAPSRKLRLDKIGRRFELRSRLQIARIIDDDLYAVDESGCDGDESDDYQCHLESELRFGGLM